MKYFPYSSPGFFQGLGLVVALSAVATWMATTPALLSLRISPLIVGILLGAVLGNTARERIPADWSSGILYAARIILRLAIILYGFRITFSQIEAVGMNGLLVDVIMVTSTFVLGSVLGIKVFGMDKETAIMTAAGAAICGAAAVVATEPIVKAEPHKTAVAIGTVVLFGTLSMFAYPFAYRMGWVPMSENVFGIYIGATVHEVAHVVGAGEAVGALAAQTSIIVKMTRVMLLAPALIVLGWVLARGAEADTGERTPVMIPWFAVGFIAVAGFNSLNLLPEAVVQSLNVFDTFLLTMAMTALGIETNASKFKGVGLAPIYLALALFGWLVGGGYVVTRVLMGA
jgi:uncharacterized integral membrane protein (TIGR00698 family)